MKKLWRSRLSGHLKEQFKYLQLVFNDHFVLALIILLGALLYGYSRLIKTLKPLWWLTPGLAALLVFLTALGQLAAMVQTADATFLLPQTSAFSKYLMKARRYSMILPTVLLLFATLAVYPLLGVLGHGDLASALTLAVALLAAKDTDLWLQLLNFYQNKRPQWQQRWVLFILEFIALLAGLYVHPAIAMAVMLAADLLLRWVIGDTFKPQNLNWLGLIAAETKRMGRLYRFYNLFTDVPGLGSSVKRRKYLDGFAKLIPAKTRHSWAYLYLRGFLRRSTYLGLYLRLAIVGAVVLAFVNQWWLGLLLAALFVYLVGFQLLPFYLEYDEIVFTHLYPLPKSQQPAAFQHLTAVLLVILAVILTIGSAFTGQWLTLAAVFAGSIVMALGFAIWYLPLRLAKLRR